MLRVGKKTFSWNSTKAKLAGVPTEKLRSVDWDEKITRELVYAMRRDGTPLGATSGKYEGGMLKLKFLVEDWFGTGILNPGFLDLLTLGKSVGLADVELDFNLQWFEEVVSPTSGGVININFPTLVVANPKVALAESTTASEVDVDFLVIDPIQSSGTQLPSLIRALVF